MKTYCYVEPVDETGVQEVCVTEKEILSEYWDWWYAKMITKYGEDHELITEQNCIEDWATTHWATEKKS